MANISTRKRGTKWEYYFEIAKAQGKRKRYSKRGFATKAEALKAGTQALAEYNASGTTFQPSVMSFSDYLDYWLEKCAGVQLGKETVVSYSKKIKNHIKPALGAYYLKNLTSAALQDFINDEFNKGYSINSISVIKGILSSSLNYAVAPCQFIKSNPMAFVKMPGKRAIAKAETNKKPHIYLPLI